MIVKLALLLLAVVLLLGAVGRWTGRSRSGPPADGVEPARKCPDCGAYVLGKTPEPCARPACPMR